MLIVSLIKQDGEMRRPRAALEKSNGPRRITSSGRDMLGAPWRCGGRPLGNVRWGDEGRQCGNGIRRLIKPDGASPVD
jgi:hypothetical protein